MQEPEITSISGDEIAKQREAQKRQETQYSTITPEHQNYVSMSGEDEELERARSQFLTFAKLYGERLRTRLMHTTAMYLFRQRKARERAAAKHNTPLPAKAKPAGFTPRKWKLPLSPENVTEPNS
jgi:hypothetical protein